MNFGHKPNHHPTYKFARNPAVGQSYEEIWDASTNKTRLTSASTMRVKAGGNAADIEGSTGASKIKIYGIDANYNIQTDEITLNGASASTATTNTYLSLYRAKVIEMSSTATARTDVGAITIEAVTGGSTQASIPADLGQTTMSHATVPVGYTYFVTSISGGVGKNDDAEFTFEVRPFGQGWQAKKVFRAYQNNINLPLDAWIKIDEKSDIVMRAKASTGTIAVTSTYGGILVKTSEIGYFPDL